MPRSRRSTRYLKLREKLVEARIAAHLTQTELAARLNRPQSFVSRYESGERRLDVIEFLEVIRELGTDPVGIIEALNAIEPTYSVVGK